MFVCDNNAKLIWGFPKPSFIAQNNYPFYTRPIKLLTNVGSISVIQAIPTRIKEGEVFGTKAPKYKIYDTSKNNTLSKKLLIALISSYNGNDYSLGYTSIFKGFISKKLINPFPGIYTNNSLNPLFDGESFIPILTDSQGEVSFNSTFFSVFGPSGKYKLKIYCDGISIITREINVFFFFFYIKLEKIGFNYS